MFNSDNSSPSPLPLRAVHRRRGGQAPRNYIRNPNIRRGPSDTSTEDDTPDARINRNYSPNIRRGPSDTDTQHESPALSERQT